MLTSHSFAICDDSQVGETRRAVADICEGRAMGETEAGKVALAITELGRNLVRHAGGGELVIREILGAGTFGIEILSIDSGGGITNIAEALRDGYSTGGTSGTGLGALKRLADRFEIYTQVGKGTVASCFIGDEVMTSRFLVGAVSLPLAGEMVCGDSWDVLESDASIRMIVADGLGHGPFAHDASREAVEVFRSTSRTAPAQTMDLVHQALGKTRGAAGAVVQIDTGKMELTSAGIGNVAMRVIIDDTSKSLISDNGTLGGTARQARDYHIAWKAGSILVMHSDGLGSRWDFNGYPGLMHRHPSIIAGLLYRDYRRERDDATVVVVVEKP